MSGEPKGDPGELTATISALREAYDRAVTAIEGHPDRQQALDAATRLADQLRTIADSAAELRARVVERIWEEESLSLTGLGSRVGVSKARAAQILQVAKKSREKIGPEEATNG